MTPKTPEEIRETIEWLRAREEHSFYLKDAADALEYLLQFVEWKPLTDEDKTTEPKLCFQMNHKNYSVNRWRSAWQIVGNAPEHEESVWLPLPPPPPLPHLA